MAIYNGWANYATWRVNLEVFDGMDPREYWADCDDVYSLSRALKDWLESYIDETTPDGIAKDYALAFVSDVAFYDIAEHMADYYELFKDETELEPESAE